MLYVPLLVVVVNSFNADTTFAWPPTRFTVDWWGRAFSTPGVLTSLGVSVQAGLLSTALALILGTMAAFAPARFRFFGRDGVSLLLILPIALPGIVTGIALNNAFRTILGIQLGFLTVVVAHSTFCIVTVFNNVLAGLRRSGSDLQQASAGLLAFALSFDEIIVTQFTIGAGIQTLPVWILDNLARPNQAPVVNVVATVLVVISAVPVHLAQRLSATSGAAAAR